MNSTTTNPTSEFIKGFITLCISLIIMGIVVVTIQSLYNPSTEQAVSTAKELLLDSNGANPEPKEKIVVWGSLIFGVLSFFGVYPVVTKYYNQKKTQFSLNAFYCICILSLVVIAYACYEALIAPNPYSDPPQNAQDMVGKTNGAFYFIKTFLYKNYFIYIIFLWPLMMFLFTKPPQIIQKLYAKHQVLIGKLILACCGLLALVTVGISTFEFPYTFENKFDVNSVYYSVVQVYNGYPLLVDHFTNTYGLYPHFIMPVLKFFGFGVLSFSGTMGVLLGICFLLLTYFLYKQTNHRLFVLLGFTSVFFNCYMYARIVMNYDSYFAICPIRWLFPFMLFAFVSFYVANINKPIRSKLFNNKIPVLKLFDIIPIQLLSFLFFSIGILWNPDFGTLTFMSLIALYVYNNVSSQLLIKAIKNSIVLIVLALLMAAFVFYLYIVIIKVSYGAAPDLSLMFNTITVFSSIGYYMLPMPDGFHPWMLFVLIYLIGLLYAIINLIKKQHDAKTSIIFLLSFFGIASFSYYQGRSHNWNLTASNYTAFILLTLFANEMYLLQKKQKHFALPFSIALFFIGFSVYQTAYSHTEISNLIYSKKDKAANQQEQNLIEQKANYIHSLCTDKERVIILSAMQYQGLLHTLSKTASAFNPGFVDLFLKTDFRKFLNVLQNHDYKVFFDPDLFRLANAQAQAIIAANYKINPIDPNSGGLLYLTKKIASPQHPFVLNNTKNSVLHEIFDTQRDTLSNYALGKAGGIQLDSSFSIQILFKPQAIPSYQLTSNATLLCNADSSRGLGLYQNGANPNQYALVIGNNGTVCPVNPDKLNYLCFNVQGRQVTAYANGNLVAKQFLSQAYINTNAPLYVGNYKNMGGFYFGDIKEINISNNIIIEEQIKQVQESINLLN